MDTTDTRDLPYCHTFGYLFLKTASEDKLSCRISLPVKTRCTGFQRSTHLVHFFSLRQLNSFISTGTVQARLH